MNLTPWIAHENLDQIRDAINHVDTNPINCIFTDVVTYQ